MRKLISILITISIILTAFCSCATTPKMTTELATTPNGYLIEPGEACTVEGYYTYEVVEYDGEHTNLIPEAEKLVRSWWNDDETFKNPEIVWVDIYEDFRGFQDSGYIFLDTDATSEDILATIVHEWIHFLVDPSTLINYEDGWGRTVMEMVVESITVDIMEVAGYTVEPTPNYLYFKDNTKIWIHKVELEKAFRNQEDYTAYERIFGEDYIEIVETATAILRV